MTKSYDLFDHLDSYLTRPKYSAPRDQRFYPSEASVVYTDSHGDRVVDGGCLRSSYFRIVGGYEKEPFDATTEIRFKTGVIMESLLIGYFKEMGVWLANNVKFVDKVHNVSGEVDVILYDPEKKEAYLGEVKSTYGYFAEKELFGNRSTKPFPKIPHLLQLMIYLDFLKKDFKEGKLIYILRDSLKRKTFDIVLVQEDGKTWPEIDGEVCKLFSMEDVYERYATLQKHIEELDVPPKDYSLMYTPEEIEDKAAKGKIGKTKFAAWQNGKLKKDELIGDWRCRLCSYRSVCYDK